MRASAILGGSHRLLIPFKHDEFIWTHVSCLDQMQKICVCRSWKLSFCNVVWGGKISASFPLSFFVSLPSSLFLTLTRRVSVARNERGGGETRTLPTSYHITEWQLSSSAYVDRLHLVHICSSQSNMQINSSSCCGMKRWCCMMRHAGCRGDSHVLGMRLCGTNIFVTLCLGICCGSCKRSLLTVVTH